MRSVPGESSIQRLALLLMERLGPDTFRWTGSPPGPGIDAVGWRLADAGRFLFSVSTHSGGLPDGRYDLQVSVIDDTLDNGSIVFLDKVGLAELCEVVERFMNGDVVERFG
jgi:hypothetical protein